MKRIISLFLSLMFVFTATIPSLAYAEESLADAPNFEATQIKIDPLNRELLEVTIAKYQIPIEVATDMRRYSDVCIENNVTDGEISYYVPIETRSSSTNTRTYKGYNNRTYYEEYVTYSYATSKDTQVKKGIATENEVKQDLKTGANLIVSNISQYKIGAIYSLLDALGLNEPSNLAYNLSVRVRESKIKRYTYVVEGSQKHFGSLVESSTHYYKFYDDGYESFSTYPVTWETDHFKSGYDKIAYQAYANGGDQEYFLNYVVGGSKIRSLF